MEPKNESASPIKTEHRRKNKHKSKSKNITPIDAMNDMGLDAEDLHNMSEDALDKMIQQTQAKLT